MRTLLRHACIIAAAVLCLACEKSQPPIGMPTKERVVEAYMAAMRARDMDALKSLTHPSFLHGLDQHATRTLERQLEIKMDLQTLSTPKPKLVELDPSDDPTKGGLFFVYPVPTHAYEYTVKPSYRRPGPTRVYLGQRDGRWYFTVPTTRSAPKK